MNTRPFNLSVDVVAAGSIVAAFAGYLPALAAFAAFLWYMVQVYESKTGQRFVAWVKRLVTRKPPSGDADPSQ